MVDISNVKVPDDFKCAITSELMIEPVRTNCPGINSSNILRRIYNAIFAKKNFNGHVFENVALASWLERNSSCPICRHRITSVVLDRDMANKIKKQFVDVNEANTEYFKNVKKELDEDLTTVHLRGNIFFNSQSNFEIFKENLNKFIHNPKRTYNELFYPKDEVEFCIRTNDLRRAETITDKGFFLDFGRAQEKRFLKLIAKAYINRRFSDANMINAIRVINKAFYLNSYQTFAFANEKKELLQNIFDKSLDNNSLKIAENVARIINNTESNRYRIIRLRNPLTNYMELIARAYINNSYSQENMNEAQRIISSDITNVSLKEELNTLIYFKHLENNDHKAAFECIKSTQIGLNKYITYIYLSFFIGFRTIKNKILKLSMALKNFHHRLKA